MLAVIQTHPVQYHAPVYREVQRLGVPVTAIYGSDFSVQGYLDREFGTRFAWDTDLLSGYSAEFLSRSASGGARSFDEVSARGVGASLARLAPRAVLIGGYSPSFHRWALLAAIRQRRPVLFRGETTDSQPTSHLKDRMRRLALRAWYSQCSRCLFVGSRSQRHYTELGVNADKLTFSPYCVDESSFEADDHARERLRASTRASLGISDSDRVLLFSGKLTPKKRPDLLVAALAALQRRVAERVVAVFVGDGELRSALEAQAAALGVAITLVGFTPQRELSRYYHAADVMVLPSQHSETWGLVINEALLHGIPCVVSKAVGSGDDLVVPGHTGQVFATGAVDQLAGALQQVLPLANQPHTRARCRAVVAGFSVHRAAEGIVDAYRQVTHDAR